MNESISNNTLLAAIRIGGPDARDFLQGQLSCDLRKLTPNSVLVGSCNSPQGRVQAAFTLVERHDGIVMLLPAAILESTLLRLRKYVLRSKVTLHDERQNLYLHLYSEAQLLARGESAALAMGAHAQTNGTSVIRWHDEANARFIVLNAISETQNEMSADEWLLADARAGLPHIFSSTYEAFTAQMLNLDLLDGISFDKGCYTGQEIIARTHYRGTIKRRMLRFSAAGNPPAPGTRVLTNGEHAGDVVYAASAEHGCELLAVLALDRADAQLTLEGDASVALQRLTLPYSLS